jgi:hypothetical protein
MNANIQFQLGVLTTLLNAQEERYTLAIRQGSFADAKLVRDSIKALDAEMQNLLRLASEGGKVIHLTPVE